MAPPILRFLQNSSNKLNFHGLLPRHAWANFKLLDMSIPLTGTLPLSLFQCIWSGVRYFQKVDPSKSNSWRHLSLDFCKTLQTSLISIAQTRLDNPQITRFVYSTHRIFAIQPISMFMEWCALYPQGGSFKILLLAPPILKFLQNSSSKLNFHCLWPRHAWTILKLLDESIPQ